jgi:hypothetical protein
MMLDLPRYFRRLHWLADLEVLVAATVASAALARRSSSRRDGVGVRVTAEREIWRAGTATRTVCRSVAPPGEDAA